jgi:hypothetical protein
MASKYKEIVQLEQALTTKKIRNIKTDGAYAVYLDVITHWVDEVKPQGNMVQTKKQYPELSMAYTIRFPEGKVPNQPVACVRILQIVLKLPGQKLRSSACSHILSLEGTESYQGLYELKIDWMLYHEINDVCKTDDGPPPTSLTTFSLVQRCIDETTCTFVCVYRTSFLMETDYVKQLTLDVIKFGITYSVNSRNGQYARDRDNGWRSVSTAPVAKKLRSSRTS